MTSLKNLPPQLLWAQDRTAVSAKGFAQGNRLNNALAADPCEFERSFARPPQDTGSMSVVDPQESVPGQGGRIGGQRCDRAVVGEKTVGEQHEPGARSAALDAGGQVVGALVAELKDGTFEQAGRILKRGMRAFIDEGMGEAANQGLGQNQVAQVTGWDQQSRRGIEESGQGLFKGKVEVVVAGGHSRGGNIKAVKGCALLQCGDHFGMAR